MGMGARVPNLWDVMLDDLRWSWCNNRNSALITQSCLLLCNPMDCSLPGSSIHGIFQTRILEWVAISFSRGSSWPRDQTQVFRTVGRRFTLWATREVLRLSLMGSKITADGDRSHEIKRLLLLGRKVMTNLDSFLKSRDITLPTKVRLVKVMVFPVDVRVGLWRKLSAEELMLLNCGVGEHSWESLGLQGDRTSPF